MPTILDILNKTEAFFKEKAIPNPRLDAELLIAHQLGCKRLDLYLQFDKPLSSNDLNALRSFVKRRSLREPLQHIVGTAPFMDLELKVTPDTLIPRPETEELVHTLVQRWKGGAPTRILDLGTGTGAIAISLAQALPDTTVVAADISLKALSIAQENISKYNLQDRITLQESNWFESLEGPFDAIISNPPYLTEEEHISAQPEVKDFDPKFALVANNDGLADIFQIMDSAPTSLKPNGLLALETGIHQHPQILQHAKSLSYSQSESLKDTSGRDRFVILSN